MAGFIYIMSNPAFPNLIKIGKSKKDPTTDRVNELNQTGVPEPFKVEYFAFVGNDDGLESYIHKKYSNKRPNKKREFFAVSIPNAINAIKEGAENYGGLKYEEIFHSIKNYLNNLIDETWWEDRILPREQPTLVKIKNEIKKCSDINQCNERGRTILHNVIIYENETVLSGFPWSSSRSILEYLLGLGANPNVLDINGEAPIHMVQNPKSAELLIEAGANVNIQNKEGNTGLHEAIFIQDYELIKIFINAKIDVNIINSSKDTALHEACKYGDDKSIILLLTNNASANMSNNDGNTPLHLLAYYKFDFFNFENVINTFIRYNADFNLKNSDGYTIMNIAKINSTFPINSKLKKLFT